MYRDYPNVRNYETLKYSRKSRSDDPLLSVEEVLAKHNQILEEYAEKHLGGSIPDENSYQEVASSETLDGRPEMLRLLKAIESPAIKAILVVEVQRLSRGDLEDAGRLIKILRYTNTLVITPTKTYDLRDEYDRDAFERELKRGNEYLEYFKKIQNRGRLESVKSGNYIGSVPPYGYDKSTIVDGKKTCPTLVINEEEAAVVRMIFDWYVNDDIGQQMICRRLEDLGIKSRTGNKDWSAFSINMMLQNVHYIGKVRWNFRKVDISIEDMEVKKTRTYAKSVDEYLIFDGKHEPIISEELFNKAQKIKGKKYKTRTDNTLKNPFTGLIYCKCGRKVGYNAYMSKGVQTARPVLKCNNQVHCRNGSAPFDEVMEYVCNVLKETIEDFKIRIEQKEDNSAKLHINLIKNLERKLKELEEKELLQWEAQYDPDETKRLPQHVFQKLNEKLLVEKDEINTALCNARLSIPTPVDYKEKIMQFTDALEALKNPEIPAIVKNRYLMEVIERMDYERPEIVPNRRKGVKGMWFDKKPFKLTIHLK